MSNIYLLSLVLTTVAAKVAMAVDEMNGVVVHCYGSNHSSVPERCPVLYNESVVLVCPVSGYWYTENDPNLVYKTRNCTLPLESTKRLSFVKDAGIYYCQEKPHDPKYYVNLIVLGPPEFVSFGEQTYNPVDESYSLIEVGRFNPNASISVQVFGVGPFNVSWVHNSTESSDIKQQNCYNKRINETAMRFTYQLRPPRFQASMNGVYRATVSNHYGHNSANVDFKYDKCAPPHPPVSFKPEESKHRVSKIVYEGKTLDIECGIYIDGSNSLGVCYGNSSESFNDIWINKEERCSSCQNGGHCYQMTFGTSQRYGDNCANHTVKLKVEGLKQGTDHTFYCWWGPNPDETEEFGRYDVSVMPRRDPNFWQHLGKWVIPACGILLITFVGIIILLFIVLRKPAMRKRRDDLYEEITDSESLGTIDEQISINSEDHHTVLLPNADIYASLCEVHTIGNEHYNSIARSI